MIPASFAEKYKNFRWIRNTVSSKQFGNFGNRFQQDIEPAGRYVIEDPGGSLATGWVRGSSQFKKPLVIEWNTNPDGGYDNTSWKMVLHQQYGVKGKALTKRLLKEGFDVIITLKKFRGQWETSECVDLTVVR